MNPFYKERFGYKEGDFPITEKIYREQITLKPDPALTKDYFFPSVERIKRFFLNSKTNETLIQGMH